MGKIVDGVKYMVVSSSSNLKARSFEDNIYFTLMEIFMNADAYNTCVMANNYNEQLSGGIPFKDRTSNFEYTDVLHDKKYVRELYFWLNSITKAFFEFKEEEIEEMQFCSETKSYTRFDEWWRDFESLKIMLKTRVSEIALETTRNLWIPRDYEISNIHHS